MLKTLPKIDSDKQPFFIHPKIVEAIYNAKQPEDLYKHLQNAIELEHSTIPPYLTALYSIELNYNKEVAEIIFSVVRQEMLHMTIAANVLNALGGNPIINAPNFIPTYPGPLPMIDKGLQVGLAKLSMDLVEKVFMRIELPEDPQKYPRDSIRFHSLLRTQDEEEYKTIGQFYNAIIQMIDQHPSWIKKDTSRQVVNEQWFPQNVLFPITDRVSAKKALEIIVDQGEGTDKGENPLDLQGYIAHYYNFSQILEKARLYQKPSGEYVYNTAEPINFDENHIWNLVEDSKADYYKSGSVARRLVDEFNYSYTSLLNGLHKTFNGEPNYLNTVMGLMFTLKLLAEKIVQTTITSEDLCDPEGKKDIVNKQLAPSFEYAPL